MENEFILENLESKNSSVLSSLKNFLIQDECLNTTLKESFDKVYPKINYKNATSNNPIENIDFFILPWNIKTCKTFIKIYHIFVLKAKYLFYTISVQSQNKFRRKDSDLNMLNVVSKEQRQIVDLNSELAVEKTQEAFDDLKKQICKKREHEEAMSRINLKNRDFTKKKKK